MASAIIGVPSGYTSQLLVSGNLFSGWGDRDNVIGGVQLRFTCSGLNVGAYVYLSGGPTPQNYVSGPLTSGQAQAPLAAYSLSGVYSGNFPTITSGNGNSGPWTGGNDGILLYPGDSYFVPRARLFPPYGPNCSGQYLPIWVAIDVAGSGIGRMFWEYE
jgi:hypothetical protein